MKTTPFASKVLRGVPNAAVIAVAIAVLAQPAAAIDADLAKFARPTAIPVPASNAATPAQVALGQRLFNDMRLSRDGSVACATCHNPQHAFADGKTTGIGVAAISLKRNTPSIWNVAWADSFFLDGRAATLEDQARGPIEHPLEMDMKLVDAAAILARDADTTAAFTVAYGPHSVSEANIVKALAAYERTLVSPPTRFDRWVAGDSSALTTQEIKGFEIFNGRGACSRCHSGWRFTDEAYHDIGLPSGDAGRGAVVNDPRLNNAFKTPSLRELVWTAPYMHNGFSASLEAVIDHYSGGIENRETISKDLPLLLPLSFEQRRMLVAFMKTLSSETPPQPVALDTVVISEVASYPIAMTRVSQRSLRRTASSVRIRKGEPLTIVNDDDVHHAVRVANPRIKISAEPQAPGESIVLEFPETGVYAVTCAIHPRMKLIVNVD